MSGIFQNILQTVFYFIIPAVIWVMYNNQPCLWEEKTKIQKGWITGLRSYKWQVAEGIWSLWQSDPTVLVPSDAIMIPWGNGAQKVILSLAGSENVVKWESPLKNSCQINHVAHDLLWPLASLTYCLGFGSLNIPSLKDIQCSPMPDSTTTFPSL